MEVVDIVLFTLFANSTSLYTAYTASFIIAVMSQKKIRHELALRTHTHSFNKKLKMHLIK